MERQCHSFAASAQTDDGLPGLDDLGDAELAEGGDRIDSGALGSLALGSRRSPLRWSATASPTWRGR
jgi:hypothetical protein